MQARWKYIRNFTPILFIVLCISTVQAVGLQGSASIQMIGNIDYSSFKVGIYVGSWNFNEYNASTIANTFDMSQSWWVGTPPSSNDYSAKMNQVHALNPNYKALVYRNVMSIYDYWPDEWNYANSQGWLLKDANGHYVTEGPWPDNYLVNICNSSYQQWLGAKVELWLQQYPFFDGVFADDSLFAGVSSWLFDANSTPINPATNQPFTDQQVASGFAGCLNAIVTTIGSSKIVVSNGIWNGDAFYSGSGYTNELSQVSGLTGISSEGCFRDYSTQWYSSASWLNSLNLISWIQDNFLNKSGRYFVAGGSADLLPPNATTDQVMIYGFSSMLLATKYPSPQNTIDFGDLWNFTEYPTELQLAQRLRNLDMVEPMNDYYQISSTPVYARDFVKGKVLVNPSSTDYTVSLNGTYTTFYYNSIVTSSILVPAHTGIILLN